MNRLAGNRGETLIESLTSILIAALVFAFLSGAAVTAAKINAGTKSIDTSFHYSNEGGKDAKVKLTGKRLEAEGQIELYENNGYYYYTAEVDGQ